MIRTDRESTVECEACGKPSIRRELFVLKLGQGGRFVSYDTHSESIAEPEHTAALQRMDGFFQTAFSLITRLRNSGMASLPGGMIVGWDFETVRPSACERRVLFRLLATIRAYGLNEEVALDFEPLVELAELDDETIFSRITHAAAGAVERLRQRFNEGRF